MGLFGRIFDKKNCSICGGEIGLLGNRKLEDGNLCKNCNAKLSPFFDERRHSTVEHISEHLAYREANRQAVAAFRPTRTMGTTTKVMVDETAGTFVVSGSSSWRENNPDVIPLNAVADVKLNISDSRSEIKLERKTPDGKTERVSYNPPRYKYTYQFYLEIVMNEDFRWFNRIRIHLNNTEVSLDTYTLSRTSLGRPVAINPRANVHYCEFERMGEDMRQALLMGRSFTRQQAVPTAGAPGPMPVPQPAAPAAVTVECAYCGSAFTPDGSGRCPCCDAPL